MSRIAVIIVFGLLSCVQENVSTKCESMFDLRLYNCKDNETIVNENIEIGNLYSISHGPAMYDPEDTISTNNHGILSVCESTMGEILLQGYLRLLINKDIEKTFFFYNDSIGNPVIKFGNFEKAKLNYGCLYNLNTGTMEYYDFLGNREAHEFKIITIELK